MDRKKEGKAPPDHRQLHEVQVTAHAGIGLARHRLGAQVLTLTEHQHQDGDVHQRRRQIGPAPAPQRAQPHEEHRGHRPAQIARQAVGAKGITQARSRHPLVQDAEVHRVERAVAQPRQDRHPHQHRIAGGHSCQHTRQSKQGQRRKQGWTRADAIYDKTRCHLPRARDHKKHRTQRPQLGITQPELVHEHRKQQRQQQVTKVRRCMGQTDQANDPGILPPRHTLRFGRIAPSCGRHSSPWGCNGSSRFHPPMLAGIAPSCMAGCAPHQRTSTPRLADIRQQLQSVFTKPRPGRPCLKPCVKKVTPNSGTLCANFLLPRKSSHAAHQYPQSTG